jgi:hypothetical protein
VYISFTKEISGKLIQLPSKKQNEMQLKRYHIHAPAGMVKGPVKDCHKLGHVKITRKISAKNARAKQLLKRELCLCLRRDLFYNCHHFRTY